MECIEQMPTRILLPIKIEVAKDNAFTQIVSTLDAKSKTNKYFLALEKNTAYYWRSKSNRQPKVYQVLTQQLINFILAGEAVVNHLPFSPELVQPVLNKF